MRDLQRNARRAKAAARFRAAAEKAGVVLPEGTSLAVIMLLCTLRRGPMLGAVSRAKRGGKADAMVPHPSLGAAIKAELAEFVASEKHYVITDLGTSLWLALEARELLPLAAMLAAWVETGKHGLAAAATPDKCPSRDHHRFQAWFTDWRGVFANETQALAIFNAAQPENHGLAAAATGPAEAGTTNTALGGADV